MAVPPWGPDEAGEARLMAGRTVLVTGATDGIGRETARVLFRMGATVIVHGRSRERAEEAARVIGTPAGPGRIEIAYADLASMRAVRALAAEIQRRFERLDVLLNNAGVYMTERRLTEDGLETTFAVNHLAPFLLTHSLRPVLERSSPARVVTVSSIAHQSAQLDFRNLQGERHFDGYGAYALSKLANVLFTAELARRLGGTGVTANCLHPGVIDTKLLRKGFGPGGAPVERGAETSVFLASDPGVARLSGLYFVNRRPAQPSAAARDPALARELWAVSERLAGLA